MKAYIAENKKKIEPFDEYPRDCLIENKSLITIQGESLSALGLKPVSISNPREVEDSDEYIIFNDGLYFSQELLKEFVARSKIQRNRIRFILFP